jgi:hypothetical protein
MVVETPVDNPPPITEKPEIPEHARPFCDSWGNIKTAEKKVIEESHGADFVNVYIFHLETGFYFGYQLKIKTLIMQKQANIKDTPAKTEHEARIAAREELFSIIEKQSKKILEAFLFFDRICYNQGELF